MKIFISSLIGGMAQFRGAARAAIEQLDHEPLMAEDFAAQPQSPQIACLEGVRKAAAVVLIIGSDYGATQPRSGLSATHEEYNEARDRCAVFAFIQKTVSRGPDQEKFLCEVQDWQTGVFRDSFDTAEELEKKIVRAVHRWELSRAVAPLNGEELLARSIAAIPGDRQARHMQGPALMVSIAAGPTQAILRPSELESHALQEDVEKAAFYGSTPILDRRKGREITIENDALLLSQERGGAISFDSAGNMLIQLPVQREGYVQTLIQEDIEVLLRSSLGYAVWLLDRIDPTGRLTHVAVVAAIVGAGHQTWRTRAQQAASPNSYPMRSESSVPMVHLSPAHKPRAALRANATEIVEDLIALLRRKMSV